MYYSSETVTQPKDSRVNDIKFETNTTHHVMIVPWEECHENNIDIKLTTYPFRIEATSHDGVSYHSLALTINLNQEVVSLEEVFFDLYEKGFRIHVPKANMKRRNVETLSLPRK